MRPRRPTPPRAAVRGGAGGGGRRRVKDGEAPYDRPGRRRVDVEDPASGDGRLHREDVGGMLDPLLEGIGRRSLDLHHAIEPREQKRDAQGGWTRGRALGLKRLAEESTGSTAVVARAMVMAEPPSVEAREITDKGSLNQKAVLAHRAALVDELYAASPPPRVILAKIPEHTDAAIRRPRRRVCQPISLLRTARLRHTALRVKARHQ